jgi:hypothetical protein
VPSGHFLQLLIDVEPTSANEFSGHFEQEPSDDRKWLARHSEFASHEYDSMDELSGVLLGGINTHASPKSVLYDMTLPSDLIDAKLP